MLSFEVCITGEQVLVIVMMFLHTLRVFFTGSYKAPREMNWVVGMLIFFVMLGLGFTGYLLPWDNKALFRYTSRYEDCSISTVRWDLILKHCCKVEDIVGAQTLTRFFAIHVFFLPGVLLALLAGHFFMIRKQGISGPL